VDERHEPVGAGTFDRELMWARRPILLRGLARDWTASRRWTFEGLAAMGDGVPVSLVRSVVDQEPTRLEQGDLGAYLRAVAAGTVVGGSSQSYLANAPLFSLLPELRADIPFDEVVGRRLLFRASAWLGPAGTITGLHTDNATPNVLAQIRGRKSLLLFPPDTWMYDNGKYDFCSWHSEVDLRSVDFARFPLLARARPLVARLEEADGLLVPSSWWHFVVAETPSVSVSTFAGDLTQALPWALELPRNLLHRLGLYKRGHCVCHDARDRSP
jgi:lysine-specific demethylase 8